MSDLRSLSPSDASDRLSNFIDSLIESGRKVSPRISKVSYYIIIYACASDQASILMLYVCVSTIVYLLQQLLGASQNLLQSSVSVNSVSSVIFQL